MHLLHPNIGNSAAWINLLSRKRSGRSAFVWLSRWTAELKAARQSDDAVESAVTIRRACRQIPYRWARAFVGRCVWNFRYRRIRIHPAEVRRSPNPPALRDAAFLVL